MQTLKTFVSKLFRWCLRNKNREYETRQETYRKDMETSWKDIGNIKETQRNLKETMDLMVLSLSAASKNCG